MKTTLPAALLLAPFYLLPLVQPSAPPSSIRHTAHSDSGNSITLLALNQPPCTVPSKTSVLQAKLAYRIAAEEQSAYGYSVSIKFQTTDPHRTYSAGDRGVAAVATKHDTLTLTYPIAAVWNNPQLLRPVTCYLYLHRNTGAGRSTVIAKTPPIVFRECQ